MPAIKMDNAFWNNAFCLSNPCQISTIRYREKLAKQILGDRYDGVYDFFCDVLDDGSTYKILRARRCQVLFELFLQIILLNNDVENIKGIFLSSNALEDHIDKLRDESESVLIVDDVLIHGNGIKQLYAQIDPNFSRNSVRIMVYCRALSATYIDSKLEKKFYKNFLPVFDYEWRTVSCCFVDLIVSSAIPYESFAGSLEKFAKFNEEDFSQDFNEVDRTGSSHSCSYFLFEKKSIPIFLKKIGYDACLRVYASNKFELTTFVPYIFVRSFSPANALKLFSFMVMHLDADCLAHTVKTLMIEDEKLITYQMRLFSALVNRIYGLHLQKEYPALSGVCPNRINIELCFGHEITDEFVKLRYEDIASLLKESPPYDTAKVSEDEILSNYLEIYDPDKVNMYQSLSMYYFINGQHDEECAKMKTARTVGLSTGFFYEKVDPLHFHALTAAQLRCWDYGQASGIMKSDRNGIVSMYGIAGEQHFRFIMQANKDDFRSLIINYSMSVLNSRQENGDNPQTVQPKDTTPLKIMSEEERRYQEKNKKLFDEFLSNNSNCLVEWFIPQILS